MLCFSNIRVGHSNSQQEVIDPIFFTEMVTAECYNEIIQTFEQDCWLQLDWVIAHTANSTMQMLHVFSSDHIIS